MSSKVASACACPVMVIKRPRDEVGAFLTVLPRRVFFRIDSTAASRAAFDWATSYLLSPEIDEVFLMVSSRQQRPKAAGVGAWLQRGSRVTLQDSEAERIEIECMADYCQDTCIRKGLNASKVRLESGFFGGKCSQGGLSQQLEVVSLTRPVSFLGQTCCGRQSSSRATSWSWARRGAARARTPRSMRHIMRPSQ